MVARIGQCSIGVMGRVLDQRDGLGLYALNLVQRMVALDPDTRYVLLFAKPTHARLFRDYSNVETHVLPYLSKLWWDQVTVPAAARRLGVDVLFNPKFSIPLLTRIPCAFVLQSADWYVNPKNYPWRDNIYIRLMLPLYCRKAARLLAISQATVTDLARHIPLNPARIAVTYAGVSPNFSPQRDPTALRQFQSTYALPDTFILTVARAYHSGHTLPLPYSGGNNARLMRAYQQYRRQGGTLPMVVAGTRIEEYLRKRGFGDAELSGVQFIGFVPNDLMHMAYQLATCFVLATLCESFGLPILESMSSGCPAIVPNTCASPEIAGAAARPIDPYDETDITRALLEVAGSEERRLQMRARGLERARAFSWDETARRTIAAIKELAA
jgi:glycosyltransferase involved in cell wall biosynthesis